jgi:hypothetical protein
MAGVALFIACFQAFGDARREYLANQQPVQAAETERDTARSERDRIRGERDSLATQVAALQKQLDESRAIFTAAQQENGSPQHPFTDKARCPPGLAVIENSQAIGSSEAAAQTKRREPVCVVETRATEASLAKSK